MRRFFNFKEELTVKNNIQVFENAEFGKVEVIMLDGKPYFHAAECAKLLGYKDTTNAIKQHCKGVVKHHILTNGGKQRINIIPEGDLYRLIIRSKLPAAVRFEAWVCEIVLPSIRQHGAYITDDVLDQLIENPEAAMKLFAKLKDERARKEALEQYVGKLTPKARYYDIILQCPGAVLATVIAKDYGMSAIKFNKLLHALGVQYRFKTNKTWVLYQEHDNKGYTVSNTYYINGTTHIQMCWTQKGRFWLYEYLKAHGVYPKTEQPTQLQLSEPPIV